MKAQFNNSEHTFHIDRAHVPFLEHSLGRGLYSVLTDFTEGRWTFHDVAIVVSFALHGPTGFDKHAISSAQQAIKMRFAPVYGARYRAHPDVIATLEAEGHGNYAPLAADVLTETVFGKVADDAA
ncbi:MAG: hypothetical protein M9895_05075 [Aquamicrobium sp.]|uniref:hypothetical protein n=1 Tax=Aquamicrobium sp. TaxID=1872579 RepID=UPI00349EF287|nr:hypothetical protein [Aquamicrobium sp.]MCO5158963.1 hypothetical protein [Aquamicrobium sp.]